MLTDFFRINMPYGIQKNYKGEWSAFNREYKPLGWSNIHSQSKEYENLPIWTAYKNLTEKLLFNIAGSEEAIRRNEYNEIVKVFLYDDATIPQGKKMAEYWQKYFDKLQSLSNLVIEENWKRYKPIAQLNKFGDVFINDKRFDFLSNNSDENVDTQYLFSFKGANGKKYYRVEFIETVVEDYTNTGLKLSEVVFESKKRNGVFTEICSNEDDLIRFFKKK